MTPRNWRKGKSEFLDAWKFVKNWQKFVGIHNSFQAWPETRCITANNCSLIQCQIAETQKSKLRLSTENAHIPVAIKFPSGLQKISLPPRIHLQVQWLSLCKDLGKSCLPISRNELPTLTTKICFVGRCSITAYDMALGLESWTLRLAAVKPERNLACSADSSCEKLEKPETYLRTLDEK